MVKTLIKNIKLIGVNEIFENYCVVVEDKKIIQVDNEREIDREKIDSIIDGKGNYLAPGFIDIHNHGNSGYDIMDGTEEALDSIGEFHIKNGVTSYLGTVMTSKEIIKALKNNGHYNNKEYLSQNLGTHLEGPFFSLDKKGAQPAEYISMPSIGEVKKAINSSNGRLKMVSIAPELPGALGVISYLKSQGIVVAMGHTNADYMESQRGIEYGASVATHLFNGMRSFGHRDPGIVGAALLDKRVYCEIIYDRVHVHDATVKMALRMKGTDNIVLISDAMRATGLEDGEYELGGQKVIVKNKVARLETGNLAGSTLTLREAVYNMINYLQVPMIDAIRMASLSPAKAIEVDRYKGSIEIGKDADIILIDGDINVLGTMVMGKWTSYI
ncbi:MAG: N-acetylglucosamine-6-phosphate deacetylase [Tissierellaceae bacterium]|nr:N-acetylglucosamine-6-phosphate deacetylase [Tissierellaceae bacterium]